jgi:hypothetical protein
LGVLIADLEEFQRALQDQDTRAVGDFFETAKRRRDAWLAALNTATSD